MKRIILSLLLILCFNTASQGCCREQIKTFYTTYLENVLHDSSLNKELCKSYLTEELLGKVERLRNATNIDPIIRSQDASFDAIETLAIEPLTNNWYMVTYYWNKTNNSTLVEIPIKAERVKGKCLITYITPIWNDSQYGDQLILLDCPDSLCINQETAQAFVNSFYKYYTAIYSSIPKDLNSKLVPLRNKYLSEKALMQYENAKLDNLMDGHNGYDLLIDNYDFDVVWRDSLKIEHLNDNECLVSYKVNKRIFKIAISVIKECDNFVIDRIKIV